MDTGLRTQCHGPASACLGTECSHPSLNEYVLNPHPTLIEQAKAILQWRKIVTAVVAITALVFAQLTMIHTEFEYEGKAVPHWKVFVVFSGSFLMIFLMVLDLPCEGVLLAGAALYGILGIIDCDVVLGGLADSTVTSVALLFPMAKAISDTGVLNSFIGKVLGSPRSLRTAVFRVYLLVGLLSSVVNNTPMIAMMLPILELWSLRLGFDVSQLAIPMAFASQMGGSLTLMGSPTNFAAKSTFGKSGYTFGFFELTGPAALLFLFGLVFSVAFGPVLLGRTQGPGHSNGQNENTGPPLEAFFLVSFSVDPHGAFDGLKLAQAGFTRLPGIKSVENLIRDKVPVDMHEAMCAGDQIVFRASAEGVVALRATRGLQLPYESELQRLGAKRRSRAVFEVELLETSSLIGVPLHVRDLCFTHRCALLAVRKHMRRLDEARLQYANSAFLPRWESVEDTPSSTHSCEASPMGRLTFDRYNPSKGDIFLVEANCTEVDCRPWLQDFGLVRKIPHSMPPRIGRWQDTMRSVVAIVGSILAICLYVVGDVAEQPYNPALKKLTLTNNLLVLLAVLLMVKAFSLEEVYQSMDISVLMTIVGAFPFGIAIENVGLASWTASSLVDLLAPVGRLGILAAIYVVSAGLSNLISNIAVIVMMAPVCARIAHLQNISMGALVPLVTIASSAVFTCPIGHQTNLMVWPVGKYSWGDFFRFGFPWQLLHMIGCVIICGWML